MEKLTLSRRCVGTAYVDGKPFQLASLNEREYEARYANFERFLENSPKSKNIWETVKTKHLVELVAGPVYPGAPCLADDMDRLMASIGKKFKGSYQFGWNDKIIEVNNLAFAAWRCEAIRAIKEKRDLDVYTLVLQFFPSEPVEFARHNLRRSKTVVPDELQAALDKLSAKYEKFSTLLRVYLKNAS